MTEIAAADARRTKNSIITYIILTAALSSVFYAIQIRRASSGQDPAVFQVFGLMWCPGVAGLLTRFAFQRNLRGLGFVWGQTKYQFASYWIPLAYASVVYVPFWLGGYFDSNNQLLAELINRLPHLPQAARLPFRFLFLATVGMLGSCIFALGEELGWRGFLVPQLAKVTSYTRVSLISGVVWALWHYPVVLFANYHGAGPRWYSVACFTVMVLGISFLFAWMRLKSGSVWTGMLLHGSHNIFVQALFDAQTVRTRLTGIWTTEFGAGLALVAVVVAIISYSKRSELPA